MDITTLLIAVGLAMDSFSVSITNGLANRLFKTMTAVKIGLFFGVFQAVMPLCGWLAGVTVMEIISGFDHWLAFGLLSFIGGRMIYESIRETSKKLIRSQSVSVLVMFSVATSIDALAVGLSLSVLQLSIIPLALMTGVITFSLSSLGVYLGYRFGRVFHNKVEVFGGTILLAIGIKILLEHL
jgi:putative Mn2+ efflux pump MntP